MKKFSLALLAGMFSAGLFSSAQAGQSVAAFKSASPAIRAYPFERGATELQVLTGPMFSLNNNADKRPSLNDITLAIRYGVMLNTADGSGPLSGNFEVLGEVFGSGIYDGPGSVLAGATLQLRYNFVAPEAKLVPYVQIGAGGAYNDVYRETPQRLIGRSVEFNLQGSVGVRYMFSDRCAISVEALYRHISNADTASRNLGLNQVGGLVGINCFF